jgi:ATP-binding cassette subfamily B protein
MRYPVLSIGIVLVILLAQTTMLFVPVYLQRLVDAFIQLSPGAFTTWQFLLIYVLPIPGLHSVSWIFWRSSGFIASTLRPRIDRDMFERAFRAVLDQSYRFFSDNFTGSLVRRVTSLSYGFADLVDAFWWNILPMLVTVFGGMLLLGLKQPIFAGILFVWILSALYGQVWISRKKLPYDEKRATAQTIMTGAAADAMTNMTNISLFTGRLYEEKRFDDLVETHTKLRQLSWRIGEVGMLIQNVAGFVCEVAMMALVVMYWRQGVMTVGDIVFVQGILLTAFSNTHHLGGTIRRIYEAGADTHEMLDILEAIPEVLDAKGAKKLVIKRGAIEFDHVSFAYHKELVVLRDLLFSVTPKEKVALVGASGSGKTTVTKLLFRFFDLQDGAIKLDGQDISKVTQNSLREAIAYVPQEPVLFHRSLMDNIRYGLRGATDKEVVRAAKLAHCHDFILETQNGYETLVGERGVKLSGGERQRIAIARAILKDAPILVLDEATSSLDSESESLIQDALKKLMRNKTVIVIAHRLSTVMEMDRIIVMQDGKIIDEGTHDELRAKVGIYQKLWNIQAGGFQG